MWIWFDPAPADGFSKLQGVGCCAKATVGPRQNEMRRNRGSENIQISDQTIYYFKSTIH